MLFRLLVGFTVLLSLSACDTSEMESEIAPEEMSCDVIDIPPFSESLQAYYSFDADARDYSGNCRHGETRGSPKLVDGVLGKAFQFDGVDDSVVIPDSMSPLPATPSTIVFWLKIEENLDAFEGTILTWTREYLRAEVSFRVVRASNSACSLCPAFRLSDYGTGTYRNGQFPFGWILIVFRSVNEEDIDMQVLDPAGDFNLTSSVYYSSDVEGRILGQNEIIIASGDIGNVTPSSQFQGVIDELRIYNRILSTAEVMEISNIRNVDL